MNIKGISIRNIRSIVAILRNAAVPLLVLAAVTVLSCGDAGGIGKEDPLYRDFWVYDFVQELWYQVSTSKRKTSNHAVVYVDSSLTSISDSAVQSLSDQFDAVIFQNVTHNFASHYDVDNNGRVIIVVFNIRDGYSGPGSSYIGGYFWPGDYWSKESVSPDKSNESDIVYLNYIPSVHEIGSKDAWRTLAHEFQHMVNYSNVLKNKNYSTSQTETWIDEGLSEAANHLCYEEVTERIQYYNNWYYIDHSGTIIDEHPLFYWDKNDSLPNYSKSYLFFQYMRVQSQSNWGIYKIIMNSPYGDYRAVRDAMTTDINLSTWNSDAEMRFNMLLLRWYATLNGISDGGNYYSYKDAFTLAPNDGRLYTGNNVTLNSGSGVVKSSNGGSFSADGYIYLSVKSDGTEEDFVNPFGDNGYFIAVYKNNGSSGSSSGYSSLPNINYNLSTNVNQLNGLSSIFRNQITTPPSYKIDGVFRKRLFLHQSN